MYYIVWLLLSSSIMQKQIKGQQLRDEFLSLLQTV